MLLWLFASLFLSGCAGLPLDARQSAVDSHAIALSDQTTLGQIALRSTPAPEQTGFRLMPLGSFSLDTRLELARRAEKTLDVQYYQIKNDETGRLLLRALRDAALRGVRVRLLMDDFYTSGEDEVLLGLAAFPNMEIRLFNPFCCARNQGQLVRFAAALNEFSRVNHRMHNKLFIADAAMGVVGGRNVANEYYLRGSRENFVDLDVFTIGHIVPDLERAFDWYWNSAQVIPLKGVARSAVPDRELRERFDFITGPMTTPPLPPLPPNDVLGYGPVSEDLDAGQVGLIWGMATLLADPPDKLLRKTDALLMDGVTYNVVDAILKAQEEVVVSSPYLVPGERGIKVMKSLAERNVRQQIITNSLAATDESVVHTGYARYRPDMLRLNVELYELSTSRLMKNKRQSELFGSSLGRLHAKLVVIDKRMLFIGSMNLDPRSARTNTEMGLIIDNPQLAKELLRVIDIDKLQSAYRVRLLKDGRCCDWVSADDDGEMVLTTEPDSTFWLRLKTWLLTPFIDEELL